jgi:hypothetical protein
VNPLSAALGRLELPEIEEANGEACERMAEARPVLVDFLPAAEVIPEMTPTTIQLAGPPISWECRSGPQRGAILGAIMFEELADNPSDAEELVLSGEIELVPNHHRSSVGPMAGAISAHVPVWVVRDARHGNLAYCSLETDFSFGAHDRQTLKMLAWLRDVLQPALSSALAASDGIELNPITAKALQMGDDCHSRCDASSALVKAALTRLLLASDVERSTIGELLDFLDEDPVTYLGIWMAACKATADAARNVSGSTVCTAIARNGTECGIQVSGLGDRWFTGPASLIVDEGIYFAGYGPGDAALDIGDSAITETVGLGGSAIYASPAQWPFFGDHPEPKARHVQEMMWKVCAARHPQFVIPALDHQGVALGIDARKVVAERFEPVVTTAIAPKDPVRIGRMIGAGLSRAPLAAFKAACAAMEERLGV